jgi:predicted transcriptional regulator
MRQEKFPVEILKLYRREREIAELVYEHRSVTAKQVQERLSDPLTNAAVRSMLTRLVHKGILARERKECGTEYLYRPAVTQTSSQVRALNQLADDFFDGSLLEAAAAVVDLALKTESRSPERFAAPSSRAA